MRDLLPDDDPSLLHVAHSASSSCSILNPVRQDQAGQEIAGRKRNAKVKVFVTRGASAVRGMCSRSSSEKAMQLTNEQRTAWEQDGFLVIEDLFPRDEIPRMIAEVEGVLAEVREEARGAGRTPEQILASGVYVGLSVKRAFFREVARDPRLLDVLEGLIGPQIGFLSDKVVFKDRAVDYESPWHQDWAYWGGSHKISVWIALDEATPENGCLQILPGSHRAAVEHDQALGVPGFGNRLDPTERGLDMSCAATIPARPGTAIFFHDLTLHASLPNRSGKDRRALIITYRDLSQPDKEYADLPAAAPVRG
jgi:phytanoyl-CoA hydroxylase